MLVIGAALVSLLVTDLLRLSEISLGISICRVVICEWDTCVILPCRGSVTIMEEGVETLYKPEVGRTEVKQRLLDMIGSLSSCAYSSNGG